MSSKEGNLVVLLSDYILKSFDSIVLSLDFGLKVSNSLKDTLFKRLLQLFYLDSGDRKVSKGRIRVFLKGTKV